MQLKFKPDKALFFLYHAWLGLLLTSTTKGAYRTFKKLSEKISHKICKNHSQQAILEKLLIIGRASMINAVSYLLKILQSLLLQKNPKIFRIILSESFQQNLTQAGFPNLLLFRVWFRQRFSTNQNDIIWQS